MAFTESERWLFQAWSIYFPSFCKLIYLDKLCWSLSINSRIGKLRGSSRSQPLGRETIYGAIHYSRMFGANASIRSNLKWTLTGVNKRADEITSGPVSALQMSGLIIIDLSPLVILFCKLVLRLFCFLCNWLYQIIYKDNNTYVYVVYYSKDLKLLICLAE